MTLKQNIVGFFTMLGRLPVKLLMQEWLYVRDCFMNLWQALKNRQWLAILRGLGSLLGVLLTYGAFAFLIKTILEPLTLIILLVPLLPLVYLVVLLLKLFLLLVFPMKEDLDLLLTQMIDWLLKPLLLLSTNIIQLSELIYTNTFLFYKIHTLDSEGIIWTPLVPFILFAVLYFSVQVRLNYLKVPSKFVQIWHEVKYIMPAYLITHCLFIDIPCFIAYKIQNKDMIFEISDKLQFVIISLPILFVLYSAYRVAQKKQETQHGYELYLTPIFLSLCMTLTALLNFQTLYPNGIGDAPNREFYGDHIASIKVGFPILNLLLAIISTFLFTQWHTHSPKLWLKLKQWFRKPSS
jgi:hypothetical protein